MHLVRKNGFLPDKMSVKKAAVPTATLRGLPSRGTRLDPFTLVPRTVISVAACISLACWTTHPLIKSLGMRDGAEMFWWVSVRTGNSHQWFGVPRRPKRRFLASPLGTLSPRAAWNPSRKISTFGFALAGLKVQWFSPALAQGGSHQRHTIPFWGILADQVDTQMLLRDHDSYNPLRWLSPSAVMFLLEQFHAVDLRGFVQRRACTPPLLYQARAEIPESCPSMIHTAVLRPPTSHRSWVSLACAAAIQFAHSHLRTACGSPLSRRTPKRRLARAGGLTAASSLLALRGRLVQSIIIVLYPVHYI